MNKYFAMDESIFAITEKYPDSIPYLVKKGFTPLSNPVMRKVMGKQISLIKALQSKQIDVTTCEREMVALIENAIGRGYSESTSSQEPQSKTSGKDAGKHQIRIEGVLPCPIRIPLFERFEAFYEEQTTSYASKYEKYAFSYALKPANLGIDWLYDDVSSGKAENLPDLLFSAGFDLFFNKKLMGAFIEQNTFYSVMQTMNKDFCNDSLDLRDPHNNYAIIAVVPVIMVVNTELLNGRAVPKTWNALLSKEFEYSVSLPAGDLDVFNSVTLNIYSRFGEEGLQKLAKACSTYLHPAQMVKISHNAETQPAVSIAPYFFTKLIQRNSPLKAVWPEDGAIIAPIFMMVKNETAEITKPFADFFLSEQTGYVFAQNGYFPSTNPLVDNKLSPDKKFSWVGWDFIYQHDIGILLENIRLKFKGRAFTGR